MSITNKTKCTHKKIEKVQDKLRPLGAGFRIFEIWVCQCGHWEERMTDFITYGRGKNEERYKINIIKEKNNDKK